MRVAGGKHLRVLVAGTQTAPTAGGATTLAASVALPAVAHFVFDGSEWLLEPTALRMLDDQGEALTLQTPSGPGQRALLSGGKSLVLGTSEAARTAVLYLDGRELVRLQVHLVGGEVTTFGPGDFPVGVAGALPGGTASAGGSLQQP